MKLKTILLVLPPAMLLVTPAVAIQINWGSPVDSVLRDSFGIPLDDSFTIQLGFFKDTLEGPFVPTADNASQWSQQWQVFDQAAFSPADGYFTSSALLNADGSSSSPSADHPLGLDFSNQYPYIWIHNSETPGENTQWFLARSTAGPAWKFPDKGPACCDDHPPVEWSVSDFAPNGPNPADMPVYGKQGNTAGAGEYTTTGDYTLQTFTFVPEPSAALLAVLGGVCAALRRRRA